MAGRGRPATDRQRRAAARVRWAGVAGALVAVLLLAFLTDDGFADPLFDRYQRWQPRPIAASRVLVVRIDADSLRLLGPWPWPRSYLALLTERLHAGGAAAVGYDILFAEIDPTNPQRFVEAFPSLSAAARAEIAALPPLDEAFANAAGTLPSVIARAAVGATGADTAGLSQRDLDVEARFVPAPPPGIATWPRSVGNFEALEFTTRGQGLINGRADADGVTRRQPMVARVAGVPTPGFALDLARVALGRETIETIADGGLRAVSVGGHRVPVDRDGRARLWFGTLPDGSEVSAVDVIRQPRDPHAYRGRIVVVGPASVGLGDIRTTPLGSPEFGVRIHAQAVDAILQGGWLSRPAWALAAEWALGGILTLVAVAGFPLWGPRRSMAVSAACTVATAAGSWTAFAAAQLLLDPMRPVLIALTAGVAITVAGFVETARAARRLRETALSQRVEMRTARDIQRAMLPDRDSLAALEPRLDLDALLEPAQLIGGDLYDAFRMNDGRVCFMIGDVTGKGAPAALFMAVSKAMAHSWVRRGDLPLDLAIFALNAELAIDSVVEVTLLCGIIDPRTGAVEMVNAGHENPWVVRADGRIEELAMEGGLPLCTLPGYIYPLERAQLTPGEALVFITDGVREAQDAAGGFFGTERTRDALAGWSPEEAARSLTDRLVAAVRGFEAGTPASDDLTVLTLRYRG